MINILFSIFNRGVLQMIRSPFTLILTLFTTPFFIFLYWIVFTDSELTTIKVYQTRVNVDNITLNSQIKSFRNSLESELKESLNKDKSKKYIIDYQIVSKEEFLKTSIDSLDADLLIRVNPNENFEFKNLHKTKPIQIFLEFKKEQVSLMQMFKIKEIINKIIYSISNFPFEVIMEGEEENKSSFSKFVPGFLVFSMIMMIFSTSMNLSFEIESGILFRYTMSQIPIFVYLLGSGFVQLFFGIISIGLSILVSLGLGFEIETNISMFLGFCFFGLCLHIFLGIFLSGFMKSTQQAFLGSSFFMFLLLIFSGIVFPKPGLIQLWGDTKVDIFSYLPTSLVKQGIEQILKEDFSFLKFLSEFISLLVYIFLSMVFSYYVYRNIFRKSEGGLKL